MWSFPYFLSWEEYLLRFSIPEKTQSTLLSTFFFVTLFSISCHDLLCNDSVRMRIWCKMTLEVPLTKIWYTSLYKTTLSLSSLDSQIIWQPKSFHFMLTYYISSSQQGIPFYYIFSMYLENFSFISFKLCHHSKKLDEKNPLKNDTQTSLMI